MAEKILLFIPMYNCEKQIPRVLKQLDGEIKEYLSEVIVVNNRSTDDSEQAVIDYLQEHPEKVPVKLLRNNENYGLGGSHKVAFNYAIDNGFDYVIVLHGDDQGSVADLLPIVKDGTYTQYDCCLGSRFMRGSRTGGYSALRKAGNYGFNLMFSLVTGKKITDLGSGLNLYKTASLKNKYYIRFPDTLYFNDCMILAQSWLKQKMLFFPISWKEEDQVSNNKIFGFGVSLLKLCFDYIKGPQKFVEKEMRTAVVSEYGYTVIFSNQNTMMEGK